MEALLRLGSADAAVAWLRQRGAHGITADSRRVQAGDAFIAWPGRTHDARRFVGAALASGARACLVEEEGVQAHAFADERVAALRDLKAAAGRVAAEFLDAPTRRLDVLAVTGTNGKTSTAWWLAQSLTLLGRRCGVIGTLGAGVPPDVVPTGLTTPDPVTLQTTFRRFADEGLAACAIEASSIGLAEHRLAGSAIRVALFTNFTRDHLDHHGTMDAYWEAKTALFEWPGLQAAVVNIDDEKGEVLAARLAPRPLDRWTCSLRHDARLTARAVGYHDGGLAFALREGKASVPVRSPLIGEFNVANLLAVIGGLRALGVSLADAAAACGRLTPVPGRMQRVSAQGAPTPQVVVDYAHTPDALEKALRALRPFARDRGGKLWCVFGCGGNRDASKRPLMGALAEQLADHVVVTSDNPRYEPPDYILSQILVGVIGHDDVDVMEDRRAAIAYALQAADARDVVLIAGKGHEATQEIAGVKHPFSDAEVAHEALSARAQGGAA